MNDWGNKKFLIFSAAITLGICLLLPLSNSVAYIKVITSIGGLIFLSLLPGYAILKILKIHQINKAKALLYSLGLSIVYCYIIALFMSLSYPPLGIKEAMSTWPIIITFGVSTLTLCLVACLVDRDFKPQKLPSTARLSLNTILLLILLPLTSILGSIFVNAYGISIISISVVVVSIAIFCLFSIKGGGKEKLYPALILSVSAAMLLRAPFTSNNIMGVDMVAEYHISQLIMNQSFWNISFPAVSLNSLASVTTLPNIYSILLGLDLVLVYKVVFPLIAIFIPLCLYYAYKELFSKAIAFIGAFFFLFFPASLAFPTQHGRIIIAELFFALLILLMVSSEITGFKRRLLNILFCFAIVMSYYVLSYLFMFAIVMAYFILIVTKKNREAKLAKGTMVLFVVVSTVGWAMYISEGRGLYDVTLIGQTMADNFMADLLSPFSRDPTMRQFLGFETMTTLIGNIGAWTYRITQFLVVFGFGAVVLKRFSKHREIGREYLALSFACLSFLFTSLILPAFATVGSVRMYQMTLLMLSPFCIIGGQTFIEFLGRLMKGAPLSMFKLSLPVIILLAGYFMYSSGLISEITGDSFNHSFAYSKTIRKTGSYELDLIRLRNYYIVGGELLSASWLTEYGESKVTLYGSGISIGTRFSPYLTPNNCRWLQYTHETGIQRLDPTGYIYEWGISTIDSIYVERDLLYRHLWYYPLSREKVEPFFVWKNNIYSNSTSRVFYYDHNRE